MSREYVVIDKETGYAYNVNGLSKHLEGINPTGVVDLNSLEEILEWVDPSDAEPVTKEDIEGALSTVNNYYRDIIIVAESLLDFLKKGKEISEEEIRKYLYDHNRMVRVLENTNLYCEYVTMVKGRRSTLPSKGEFKIKCKRYEERADRLIYYDRFTETPNLNTNQKEVCSTQIEEYDLNISDNNNIVRMIRTLGSYTEDIDDLTPFNFEVYLDLKRQVIRNLDFQKKEIVGLYDRQQE